MRARSLAGRASLLHSEGREFESLRVHQYNIYMLEQPSSKRGLLEYINEGSLTSEENDPTTFDEKSYFPKRRRVN